MRFFFFTVWTQIVFAYFSKKRHFYKKRPFFFTTTQKTQFFCFFIVLSIFSCCPFYFFQHKKKRQKQKVHIFFENPSFDTLTNSQKFIFAPLHTICVFLDQQKHYEIGENKQIKSWTDFQRNLGQIFNSKKGKSWTDFQLYSIYIYVIQHICCTHCMNPFTCALCLPRCSGFVAGPVGSNAGVQFRNQEKGVLAKGGFFRIQRHAQGHKKYPRILGPAVHLALRAPQPRSEEGNPPKKSTQNTKRTSFSEQFPLGSWLVSQGRGQKLARTFRKSSCKRGVFWGISGFWVGCWASTRDTYIIAKPLFQKPPFLGSWTFVKLRVLDGELRAQPLRGISLIEHTPKRSYSPTGKCCHRQGKKQRESSECYCRPGNKA